MRRAACLKTLAHPADPLGHATQPTASPPQDNADVRPSDLAAPAPPALGGRGLDGPWMSYPSGRPGDVDRCEHRRTEHTDDQRDWEKALAGEIHDC